MLFKKPFLNRKSLKRLPNRIRQAKPGDWIRNFPKSILKPKKLTWKRVLRGLIILAGVGILAGVILFAWYYKDLPKPGELRSRSASESTILYDRNGKQIYDISGEERRILLKANEIPDVIKDATISIEDHKFYNHHGVDILGILRGTILKPFTGEGIQGGSTITQQYIKNAILSPKRSIARKIQEIILALELEFIYTKEDILTLYLNEIPYGSNIYGVEAASQAFYGKSAKEGLTLAQAATLASIPQLPTYYSPYGNHVDALMARKNAVLDAMARYGHITQEEADKAKQEAPLETKDFAVPRENFPAPHFVMYIREQLVEKYGEQTVQRGGLRVTTTLDLDLQNMADDSVKEQAKALAGVKASNAALVAMDPKTGQVLAMVGSVDYFDRENGGNFNVATAERQPGSAGKPIVYATLLEEGKWAPGSMMWDVQTDFNGYKPNNYDGKFRGPVSIRKALGNSLNIPAVKALSLSGVKPFLDNARDMGITTFDKRENELGLSVALGGGEVRLLDLVAAYTVFANNGDKAPLTSILSIKDSKGKVLDEWKESSKSVLKPEIAYEISSILSDNDAKLPTFNGLINVLSVSGKTTAVKTGTTDNYKDAWTIGYSPSLVVGVWAGNNDGKEMNRGGGSTAAAPIWDKFMEKALKEKPNEQFRRPDSISEQTFDFLSGKKPTPASGQLVKDIFAPWQVPDKDDDVHQLIKVCKSNGKLATDNTPTDEIEEKIFSRVRSERPNVPAWENPVQAWAQGSDLVKAPPTETCDIVIRDVRVSITSPAQNEEVSGVFTVTTESKIPSGVSAYVDFTLDGAFVTRDEGDPFTVTIDSSKLSSGTHDIAAIIHGNNGSTETSRVTVRVGNDTAAPGDVSNASLIPGTSKGSAIATWTNPSDSDLESITFYVSQSSGIKGAKLATISANPGTVQTSTLTGLVSGIPNYVTIITNDTLGNSSATTKQYSVTPL